MVIECAKPMGVSCCGVEQGREEDDGGFELLEEEEAVRCGTR